MPYLSPAAINRVVDRLMRGYAQHTGTEVTYPVDLHALIWDYLNEVDDLCLDEETELGIDLETNESIWGKTIVGERLIMIDPMVTKRPFYRFTLAHELGHWILHARPLLQRRAILQRIKQNQAEQRSTFITFQRSLFAKSEDRREVQANLFASQLLMPEALVRQKFTAYFPHVDTLPTSANERKRLAESFAQQPGPDDQPPLYKYFDVSIETMAVRLLALSLIPKPAAFSSITTH
jgi:hypothetical protein